MNKKTTRLSSIALALMMVLMVALTLVPIGAALAAESAVVEVEVPGDDDGKLTSNNYIERPTGTNTKEITIKVSSAVWKDDRSFEKVMLTMNRPDDVNPFAEEEMTKSTTENGVYTYKFTIASNTRLGLWAIEVYRKDKTWTDTEPLKLGAFWLYAVDTGSVFTAATPTTKTWVTADSGFAPADTTTKAYVKPGAVLKLDLEQSSVGDLKVRYLGIDGALIAEKDGPGTATTKIPTYKYTVPSNTQHGKEFKLKALGYIGDRGDGKCEMVTFNSGSAAGNKQEIVVDAKAPEVGEIVISDADLVAKVYNGVMFAGPSSHTTGKPNVEIASITDADSGIAVDSSGETVDTYIRFVNNYDGNVKYDGTDLVLEDATTGTFEYFTKGDDRYVKALDLNSANDPLLVDGQWTLQVVAVDAVGNETIAEYGTVKAYDTYEPISNIRVEASNVIEMYVGQTLTKAQLEERGAKVWVNAQATLPDSWIWTVDSTTMANLDYDAKTGTLTARKSGEGLLVPKSAKVFVNETQTVTADGYLRIKITDEPTVSALSLNNSSMTIAVGAEQKLTATVVPAEVNPTWHSNDTSIATVDAEGNVKGIKDGVTTIVANAGSRTAVCTVTVKGDVVATGISLNKTANTMVVGASETLFATTTPAGAPVTWNTSNAAVATVDNAGKVTAMTAGTATITATSGSYSATCVVTVTGTPETLEPNQWYQDDAGNIYYSNEHSQLTVGWKKIGGYWYLFDYSTAVMKKGWAKDAGTWYYLQSDGKMKTGWLKDGSTWYYLQASGAMKTGWLKDGGVWYYLKDSGAMATGWVKVSGIWYYLQGSGAMKEGWLLESGVWYYLTPSSGAMLANGTYTVEGRKSQFAASGRWLGYV